MNSTQTSKVFAYSKLLIACLAMIMMALASTASAGNSKSKSPPKPKHSLIVAISSGSITISIGSNTKNFRINDRTLCYYQGRSVGVSDLKPGMRVNVIPAFENLYAAQIFAGDAPAATH